MQRTDWQISPDQMALLWERFHSRIEGFSDFENPGEDFAKQELNYKRKALQRYQRDIGNDKLRQWVRGGQGDMAMNELSKIIQLNLVQFNSWRVTFGTDDKLRALILGSFLDAAENPYGGPKSVEPIVRIITENKLAPSWDVFSTVLWALSPTQHMPIKISYFRELAEELNHPLPLGRVDAEKYDQVRSFLWQFKKALEPDGPTDLVDIHSFIWCVCPIHARNKKNAFIPEEIHAPEQYIEGATRTIFVNQYERNSKARAQCIKIHGAICQVCRFDFEKKYGKYGKGYIHVHHKKPLSEVNEEYEVNPATDLVPVCPNCHAMIHKSENALSVEELKAILVND